MNRYKVSILAELVFEVDAINEGEAMTSIVTHFHKRNSTDPLAGTRFTFRKDWCNAAHPRLMTTVHQETISTEAV